jgi:hypothetical protein
VIVSNEVETASILLESANENVAASEGVELVRDLVLIKETIQFVNLPTRRGIRDI